MRYFSDENTMISNYVDFTIIGLSLLESACMSCWQVAIARLLLSCKHGIRWKVWFFLLSSPTVISSAFLYMVFHRELSSPRTMTPLMAQFDIDSIFHSQLAIAEHKHRFTDPFWINFQLCLLCLLTRSLLDYYNYFTDCITSSQACSIDFIGVSTCVTYLDTL